MPGREDHDAKRGIPNNTGQLASPFGRRAYDYRASIPAVRFRICSWLGSPCSKPPSVSVRAERAADDRRALWLRGSVGKFRAGRRTPFDVPDLEAELLAASGDEPGVRIPIPPAECLGEVIP